MKVQLNTNLVPIFTGTYESIWDVTAYNDNGTQELAVDYKHEDLMASIARVYQENADYILSDLNSPFIKTLKFLGTFYSPREYNFSTDTLDFEIDIDQKELKKSVKGLKDNAEFSKFLADNFTSYDGFWSNTPNTFDGIYSQLFGKGNEFNKYDQSLGAVISFLAKDNIRSRDGDFYSGIEGQVYEDWQGNGYGGLDYKVCEHKVKDYGCKVKTCFNYSA